MYRNIIKAICDKPTANIIFSAESIKPKHIWATVSTKVRDKTRMPTLTTSTQHNAESHYQSNYTRKGNKKYQNWKGRSKTASICRCHDFI